MTMLTFASLFSGIGGFDLGFEQAGMQCAWQCEIDKRARSVLATHWPGVPCYEDVKNVKRDNVAAVDLICGGFPCQDVSIAGKREGLAGERSGLWFEFHRIIGELRPQWVVIENVPGLLSSHRGSDFAVILRGLVEFGYGVTWRILDAQYFGVAQRRRRVFIAGSLGDGRSAEVLFECNGLFGHPPARRAQGQGVAGTLAAGAHASGFNERDAERGNIVSAPLGAHHGRDDLDNGTYIVNPVADTLTAPGAGGGRRDKMIVSFDWQAAGSERTTIHDRPGATRGLSSSKTLAVAYNIQQNDGGQHKRKDRPDGGMYVNPTETALTVGTTDLTAVVGALHNGTPGRDASDAVNGHIVAGVRRLTPTECERLQGFPDGWTAGQSDSARYRQLGNAVAVPVARWIGQRIVEASHA
jgi:DNA (cytosine-5)-methyltransferase 1